MATKTKLTAVSWFERAHSDCAPKLSVKHSPHTMLVYENVLDEKLGRTIRKSSLASVDTRKKLATYKVNDFSLENLQAVGADLSKSVSMRLNSLAINDSILSSINSKS